MRTTRRRVAVRTAALTVIAALAIAACGGGGDKEGGSAAPSAGAPASGTPQPGGTLRIQVANDVANLDPAQFNNSYAVAAVQGNALYGQLLNADATTGEIKPGFAESLTTTDNSTWTLKLRPGLTFTDGTPFNAEAVKVNWDRLRDPKAAISVNLAAAAVVAETRAVDDVTLEFTLTAPSAHVGQAIVTSAMNWIASPTALAKGAEAFTAHPVGAGPFVLEEWRRGDRMVLVKNQDYFDPPRPYLDRLEIRADPEVSRRLQTLQTGGADLVIGSSDEAADEAAADGFVITRQPLNGFNMVLFNMAKPPFDDIRARQAVFLAIDRKILIDAAYAGHGELPTTLMAEESPFYDPSLTFPEPDPEKAQALFNELAAEGKPVEFTLLATQASDANKIVQSIQAQLSAYDNVKVNIESNDISTWLTRIARGDFGASVYGVITVDPEPGMARLLASGSAGNFMKLSDPQIDAALEAGRLTTDVAKRKEAYRTLQQRVIELLPFIGYVRPNGSLMASPKVGGQEVYGQLSPRLDTLWLDQNGD
ncbi:MAG: ABC transporter substrate-binding protein [Frankia sp.]|nr:ABC transporter substrate-binding protein [Frankia sp.]